MIIYKTFGKYNYSKSTIQIKSFIKLLGLRFKMLDKKEFGKIRKEIADFDIKRESLIQKSREVINISKKIPSFGEKTAVKSYVKFLVGSSIIYAIF